MKRLLTTTCFAMACAVGLVAQQQTTGTSGTTATTTDQQGQRGGPRTVTGCLRAGDTAGTYMLTDIQMANRGGDAATTGTTTTGTTSTGGTTTGTMAGGQRGQMPTSLMLNSESTVDLKAHVGHKIEVTGTMAGGGRRGGDTTSGTTGGTSTTGGSEQTTTGGQASGATRSMNVTSVRMIADSCS
jgi:hypothetical protein